MLEAEMETSSERRRRKLTELCAERGLREVATRAGLNYQSLDQIIKGTLGEPKKDGTRAVKNLGNPSARAIEVAEKLGTGWFDIEAPKNSIVIDDDDIRVKVAHLATMLEAIPASLRETAYLAALESLIGHLPRKQP